MEYTKRVNGFQIRDVDCDYKPSVDKIEFEIVKWEKLKEPEYITCLTKDDGAWKVEKKWRDEYCYVVAFLEWNDHEPCFEFRSVGLRWLESKPSEAVTDMILEFCERKEKELCSNT